MEKRSYPYQAVETDDGFCLLGPGNNQWKHFRANDYSNRGGVRVYQKFLSPYGGFRADQIPEKQWPVIFGFAEKLGAPVEARLLFASHETLKEVLLCDPEKVNPTKVHGVTIHKTFFINEDWYYGFVGDTETGEPKYFIQFHGCTTKIDIDFFETSKRYQANHPPNSMSLNPVSRSGTPEPEPTPVPEILREFFHATNTLPGGYLKLPEGFLTYIENTFEESKEDVFRVRMTQ